MTGYSGTALEKKLGIKENFSIRLINAPDNYFDLFSDWPQNIKIVKDARVKKNFIHFFTRDSSEFYTFLPLLKNEIQMNGMIWVSWPKKASMIPTEVTEDMIRNYALGIGLVDIKVCSIDNIWSGLKLVIPVKSRK